MAKPKKKTDKKDRKVLSSGSCEASYYWEGQMTASGEAFDPSELTAAHKTLPMGSKVRVTNKNNGRSVVVRINDRGPYAGGRCLDLSRAAMKKVGGTGAGVIPVRYEVLSRG
ncbi:septal ring lytic transglycosylase RlpA family protein [Actinomadura bangladeshensis]|uniref:Probable endolytic peptidoglycan transglycosylase RlpA n=1 Tax=Actinomadura bangladeshensis TaxID=453573 RepID=A0A6L9QFT5_9ACTN|nr:septal ring lytic transglycosylase RlpA family protein [Actinomadura bangladeshensis]